MSALSASSHNDQVPQDGGSVDKWYRRIAQVEERTGLKYYQIHKQRILGPSQGVCKNWEYRSEVYVGNFPVFEMEDTLISLFLGRWEVVQTRMVMRNHEGVLNNGFAFVLLANPKQAKDAAQKLNGHQLKYPNKIYPLKISVSLDNRRLFVGGIPRHITKDQTLLLISELMQISKDKVKIYMYKDWHEPSHNRGFCFLEFETHSTAMNAKILLWKRLPACLGEEKIIVNWAKPEQQVDECIMNKVKKIFIRGLRMETNASTVMAHVLEKVKFHYGPYAQNVRPIEVKKTKDYAFVHFLSHKSAEIAVSLLTNTKIDGATVEVQLARPPPTLYWDPSKPAKQNHQKSQLDTIAINPVFCKTLDCAQTSDFQPTWMALPQNDIRPQQSNNKEIDRAAVKVQLARLQPQAYCDSCKLRPKKANYQKSRLESQAINPVFVKTQDFAQTSDFQSTWMALQQYYFLPQQ